MKLKNRRFTDLTNNEVKQIINDIFEPTIKSRAGISRLKSGEECDRSCKIFGAPDISL